VSDTALLLLELRDVHGDFLQEPVDIFLANSTLASASRRISRTRVSAMLRIRGLEGMPHHRYEMAVYAPSFLPVSRFVTAGPGRHVSLTLPLNPARVARAAFPTFDDLSETKRALLDRSAAVLGHVGQRGPELYAALPGLSCAGLLNITAKCERTRLANGRTVLSYLDEVLEVRGDRFFARVPKDLREETKNAALAGLFRTASTLLHHIPDGFQTAGSWKTPDSYGNLQLTFSTNGAEWRADIDIDEAGGLEHLFQVARNAFLGATHPYTIHQILIQHQELDPGYRLLRYEEG